MPNWVINRVKVSGINVTKKLQRYFLKMEDGDLVFDFNKVKELPRELLVERSSKSYEGFKLYLTMINPRILYFGDKKDKISWENFMSLMHKVTKSFNNSYVSEYMLSKDEIIREMKKSKKEINELLSYGKEIYSNFLKYGCSDWYEWSINNWGCKWNSSENYVNDDLTEFYFQTPWTPSIKVIDELARQNPSLTFVYEYAEEQVAFYCGKLTYTLGERTNYLDYDTESKEAYELYFDLWGEDEEYQYDSRLGTYVCTD